MATLSRLIDVRVDTQIVRLHIKAAAADLILRRKKTIHNLRRLGIAILDVYPEEASARLVSRYLESKSRN